MQNLLIIYSQNNLAKSNVMLLEYSTKSIYLKISSTMVKTALYPIDSGIWVIKFIVTYPKRYDGVVTGYNNPNSF